MSFLGRLFGQKVGGKVPVVALACDTFIMFDSDDTLNEFAAQVLQNKWQGLKLHHKAQVEAAVSLKGGEDEAKAVLNDLLQQAVDTVRLEPDQYDAEFLWVQSQTLISESLVYGGCQAIIIKGA